MIQEEKLYVEDIILKSKKRHEPFCAYVYDLKQLSSHVQHLKRSLPKQCALFYAMKANPDKEILQTLEPFVDGFELASLGEVSKVNELCLNKPKVLSGPVKTDETLRKAIISGVCVIHVESEWELNRIALITEELQQEVQIALRVNLQLAIAGARLTMAGKATQFGVDEQDVPRLIHNVKGCRFIQLVGFHFHSVSNNLDAVAHAQFVSHCFQKVNEWENKFDLNVTYINVGGGVGIHYEEHDSPFDWSLFTSQVQRVINKEAHPSWKIVFELGRYMVAECGYYVSEVMDVKVNHGESFVLIRGGSHHLRLPAAWKMSHPFEVIPVNQWSYPSSRPALQDRHVTIAGELCTPNDVLARNVYCKQVRVGDLIKFKMAGAYAWTISHHDFLSHSHPEFLYI
ncbi:type III PLP-dependent enzyme [Bacillus sp. FJAT-47783]|uniref:type III PLP-dependent enzyme n=1 Tax=Bacillus sp. FJAT-47783 TaxID=2922712 RepID=UPI001FADF935|nr:type III PLP-dependent enzyme [Bacillus sp. FJAT-47783]